MTALLEEPKIRPKNRDELVPEFLFPDSYEVVNGDVREVEPKSQYAGFVANRLNSRMILYLESHRTGQTLLDMLFHIPLAEDRSRQRKPDLSYLSFERWPADRLVPFFGNPIKSSPTSPSK